MQYNQPYGVTDTNAPYINGNPTTGTMGSIPPAASIEYPQREIVNAITAAGLTPSNSDLSQLAKAIQSGQLIFAPDTGTTNALAVTLDPNVGAAFTKGFVIVTQAATTNTGPSVINVNGARNWPIVHASDQTQLNSFDININAMIALAFDGTHFQLVWSSRQPGSPVFLTGPRDYYVNGATGNDANDGQSATVTGGHGPFATLQQAANQIPLFNLNGYAITIHVADYTYTWFGHPRINGSGYVFWQGNSGSPGNVVINGINRSAAILSNLGGTVYFDGFKFQCSGSQAGDGIIGVNVYGATSVVILGNVEFGACGGAHISSQNGSMVSNYTPGCAWKISGGCTGSAYEPGSFLFCYVQGNFINNSGGGPAITISTPISLPGGFVYSVNNSFAQLVYSGLAGAGNVSGPRYTVDYNSSISTGSGANPNYYPGTVAGSSANGGYYT